ncbi:MAG: aminopeptidase [Phototrophicales bacterium]|nr:MAG: aminopeptidase [Phototrophicales bacterium]
MTDPRLVNLAKILVNYSIKVQPNDFVLISGDVLAMPLVEEVLRQVYRAGGHPFTMIRTDELQRIMYQEANDEQLQWRSPMEQIMIENIDASINIRATDNTRALTNVDPNKQRLAQLARRDMMETYMRRAATGELRWVVTQYPCPAYAQEADMSLREFEDFVYRATFADQEDPIQAWYNLHNEQQKYVDWLKGKKEIVVRGPNIDMTLSIEGRTFINSSGTHNMPSGEIFTGPVEDSVNGWVRFTYPAIRNGREVEGVELTFENGKVIKASAKKNEDYLLSQLDSDEGSRYLGEFAIGTNYGISQFTKSILYDEKIGGTIHMAVGAGYPETGSRNKSSVHWDFICDMRQDSEIYVDGELFYKNGQFQL